MVATWDGRVFSSGILSARWDPSNRLPTDAKISEKFHRLVTPILGDKKTARLEERIWHLDAKYGIMGILTASLPGTPNPSL